MVNYNKLIRNQKVKVSVCNTTLTLLNVEKNKTVKFVADGKDFYIKYNTGLLGERHIVDGYLQLKISPRPKDFINGETYNVFNYEVYSERKCRYTDGKADYYHEVFVELTDDEDYFSDILIHSDNIDIYVDDELVVKPERRVFAGFYKRYDDMRFYVVDVVRDLETKQEVVICKHDSLKASEYFTLTIQEFCSKVKVDGKLRKKYARDNLRTKANGQFYEELATDGYPLPVRKNDDSPHELRSATTYLEYAKDLCKHYNEYLQKYNMCVQMKQLVGLSNYEFDIIKEDLKFIQICLKTTLKEYVKFFVDHIMAKCSLREYAELNNINRGSAEYLRKKFLSALAEQLQKRDEADGKRRIL